MMSRPVPPPELPELTMPPQPEPVLPITEQFINVRVPLPLERAVPVLPLTTQSLKVTLPPLFQSPPPAELPGFPLAMVKPLRLTRPWKT